MDMVRPSPACLSFYAPDLGERVDEHPPVLFLPSGKACMMTSQPETCMGGWLIGKGTRTLVTQYPLCVDMAFSMPV